MNSGRTNRRLSRLSNVSIAGVALVAGVALTLAVVASLMARPTPTQAQAPLPAGWQTYTSEDAAYSFGYPPDATISTSDDASQRFKIVYAELNLTDTADYQGVSVLVLDNPNNQPLRRFVSGQYRAQGVRPSAQSQRSVVVQLADRQALKLERDSVVGALDKFTVLIPGDGVVYRLNLYGGGVGGPVEPPPAVVALFDQVVQSFRVLPQPLQPKQTLLPSAPAEAEPAVASVFTYPMRAANGVNYGIPVGIVNDNTHMEWLGYGIRNLDQWHIKCYGVDWARMIHTAEDWYRLDGGNTAGSPVYAVADGVVALHNPGISYPGNVVMLRHRLPNGRNIYSMYGHVSNVSVVQGQIVRRGQQIATVIYQGYTGRTPGQHSRSDAHLHFEMRYFLDGTAIYTPGTNAYGYNYPACTYAYPGRGYTYLIHPDNYPYPGAGYVNPSAFISARLDTGAPPTPTPTPSTCMQSELIANGGFEKGLPGTPWMASNSMNRNDPLIYKSRPHTGAWGGWLGNVANYTDTLAQAVNVPAPFSILTLTFWRQVRSAEPVGGANDRMLVQVSTAQGQPVGDPVVITSAVARNVWVKETVTLNVSGFSGQALTLSFTGSNDGKAISSFFIDDMSLTTVCP